MTKSELIKIIDTEGLDGVVSLINNLKEPSTISAKDAMIDECLSGFDFEAVSKAFKVNKFVWFGGSGEGGVPTKKDLEETAYELLSDAIDSKTTCATGRLEAAYCDEDYNGKPSVTLRCVISENTGYMPGK